MLTVLGVVYKGTVALVPALLQHTMKMYNGTAEYIHTFLSSGERLSS
jgi:hypothetical protein